MPDLVQPVVGFRRWLIEDGLLRSTGAGKAIWDPGVTVAECETGRDKTDPDDAPAPEPHTAPGADCGCGIYAYHEPGIRRPDAMSRAMNGLMRSLASGGTVSARPIEVAGAIAAWGGMEVHRDGFRAEKARVVALALDDECLEAPERRGLIEAAAAVYGAAAVPSYLLAEKAYEHGIAMPEDLLPEPELDLTPLELASGGYVWGWTASSTAGPTGWLLPDPPSRWERIKDRMRRGFGGAY